MSAIVYLIAAGALGFALGRYRATAYQNEGEALVARALQIQFPSPDYHLLNHVTLRLRNGTTQVDHVLVSRFGVFVIETKDYKGWIFANAKQPTWTQVLFKRKSKFQNPIFQNLRHVRAVQDLLDFLPREAVHSAVVFTGTAEFKTEIPPGVYDLSGFVADLRAQSAEVMSLIRMQFCVGRLETARLAISGQTDVEHIRSLERRHGGAG